ncbi:fungal-specific transcription factor domain-containing protein [Exophiala viscosa]|uniref:fungal-specific transcription factor domain-containing protein n=1 Tax=Exophiala viscosa TaxID=2486360 RepID=UPI00219A3C29|nr:fungal-specific transcription factor domain-containing protein [Exophiala viscosa]
MKRRKPRPPRRVTRPCDACRVRKTRCIPEEEGAATCISCNDRGVECTFERDPPGRQRITGTSQDRNGTTPNRPRNLPADAPAPISRFSPSVADDALQATNSEFSSHLRNSGSFHSPASIRTSIHVQGLEETNHAEPQSLGQSNHRFAELYGITSDMEPILMRHRPYDGLGNEYCLETHRIRRILQSDQGQNYPITFHTVSNEKSIGYTSSYVDVDAIEDCVNPFGPRLIKLFWRMVQPSLPLLHKAGFMSDYARGYRNVPAGLLGAVYLVSLNWWSYDSELNLRAAPESRHLRNLTMQAIQNSYHRPRLSSIQAILLLLQCKPEDPLNPDHTFCWGYVCQALGIAESVGLQLDASNWNIPAWEQRLRKRLGWALYMQDKWTSMAYGRPSHIHEDDWGLRDLHIRDFEPDQGEAPAHPDGITNLDFYHNAGMMHFMKMVELTKMLSRLQRNFYTLRTSISQNSTELYGLARPLVDELTDWYAKLDPMLNMDVKFYRQLNFCGSLHFSYYGTMINVLRRLVRSTALGARCDNNEVLASIRQLGLATVQAATKFVNDLRPDHLESFWYFTSPYLFSLLGSFTTLMLVTSLSTHERDFWQDTLNSYIWTLRTMSNSSEPMRYAANRLEGAILRGLEHALAVNIDQTTEFRPSMLSTSADMDFNNFGDWDLADLQLETFDLLAGVDLNTAGMGMLGGGRLVPG